MEAIIKMSVLIIVSILRLGVGIPLFVNARRNHQNNLYWLSAQFLCLVIALPFAAAGMFNVPWVFWTFISLSEIALAMFVHTTFYRGRKSPMPVFMALAVVGLVGGLYGNAINNFQLSAWMVYPNAVLIWGWNFVEAARAYNKIAQDASTERWVKARYLLMVTYSLIDCGGSVLGTLLTAGVWNSSIGSLIVVAINFTSVTLQILTWVMPESFRLWLNREQQARPAHEEQRPLSMLDVFGETIIASTSLKSMVCFYAIRAAVAKRIGTEDSVTIEKYLDTMTYHEWEAVLQHSELRRILINGGADQDTANKAIENARQALVEKQSLLTMGARFRVAMPLDIPRIQALCFDVDGTLSDTDDQYASTAASYFRLLRFLLPGQDAQRAARRFVMWAEAPGNLLIGIPDRFGLDNTLAALSEWLNRRHPRSMKHFLLVAGVKEMLDQFKGRYPMAVVSARGEATTLMFLDQFGLRPYFDVVVTALTAPHTKPYPDPIFYAAKTMGVRPENCLMIGDTTVDMRAGKAAGAQTLGVLCGFGEEAELRAQGADQILETTAKVAEVLLK